MKIFLSDDEQTRFSHLEDADIQDALQVTLKHTRSNFFSISTIDSSTCGPEKPNIERLTLWLGNLLYPSHH